MKAYICEQKPVNKKMFGQLLFVHYIKNAKSCLYIYIIYDL